MPRDYQLRERLGFRFSRLAKLMQARLERGLAEHELTRLKWCILSGVGLEGQTAPSDLAEHVGIARPTISKLLKELVDQGLVARRLSNEDGRGREIALTELGTVKLKTCLPIVEQNQIHFLGKLTDEQQHQLDHLLDALGSGELDKLEEL